jgi:SPP1 family predicted phage head-tail adaptor
MQAGQLSKLVTIKYPTSSSVDLAGQTNYTYTSGSVWADVQPIKGSETYSNYISANAESYIFTIRKNDTYNENSLIVYNNKTYNIVFVEKVSYNKGFYKLVAERLI